MGRPRSRRLPPPGRDRPRRRSRHHHRGRTDQLRGRTGPRRLLPHPRPPPRSPTPRALHRLRRPAPAVAERGHASTAVQRAPRSPPQPRGRPAREHPDPGRLRHHRPRHRTHLVACCDGVKGLPESINDVWPQTDVQLCVVHLVRTSLRYSAKQHWAAIARQLREVYTAKTADEAEQRFVRFEEEWGQRYPAVIDTWRRNWEHVIVFMRFPAPIRRVVYTTNMIESLNSRFRQARGDAATSPTTTRH
ncbi:transposase [Streptomyces mirabilis]|uniref:transposase n=1 Tax=Streptomyces mirabilis TaxID=68239 RepID=UPI003655711C